MSRLESQAKAGFYPTPPRVVAAITAHLAVAPMGGRSVVRLLDPRVGEGEAAAVLSGALGAESYGIELNETRATAARVRLDHVLSGSAFAVWLSNGAFYCLFLNPPYDRDEGHRRLEHAFLIGLSRALCPGGGLVFLIPQGRLAHSSRYLAAHYTGHIAYRFPDPEYAAFGQIVLFAAKKARVVADPEAEARLIAWADAALPPLPDRPADTAPRCRVPTLPVGEPTFASLFFDPSGAVDEARRRGVWASSHLAERLWPADEAPVRPLMPLRKGHLALLIAAGMLNNVALERDGQCVLVKGRTYKATVTTESDDGATLVEREILRTSIVLLDLTTGTLTIVDQGGEPPVPLSLAPPPPVAPVDRAA